MSEAAVSVHGLGKRYRVWTHARPTNLKERVGTVFAGATARLRGSRSPLRRDIWALRNVSFDVRRGEVLGLIGPNGAGKSTLLAILARVTEPTEGYAEIRGRVGSLLEVGTGFHPELTGRDNIFLNGAVLGMSRAETARKFGEIVEFSGLEEFIDIPVKRYSTGMYTRLAFSVAAHLDPEILLIDEVLSVGDQAFQAKSLDRIEQVTRSGKTVVFVSHDVSSVARLCRRALLVREGQVEFEGPVDAAIERYLGNRKVLFGGGDLRSAEHEGTGELRLRSVLVENAEGGSAVQAEQPAVVRIELATERRVRAAHLALDIAITSPVAGHLVSLSTRFAADSPFPAEEVDDGATVVCRLNELPLRPGNYFLGVTLSRLGEVIDRVQNQIEFTIVPSDFFGTGVLPPEHQPPVLVRHSWSVAEPAVVQTGSR